MRLQGREGRTIERARVDAEGPHLVHLLERRLASGLRAESLDPAAVAEQRLGARRRRQSLVLGQGARDERTRRLGAALTALRRRSQKIAPDERRDGRQRAVANLGAKIAVQRGLRNLAQGD